MRAGSSLPDHYACSHRCDEEDDDDQIMINNNDENYHDAVKKEKLKKIRHKLSIPDHYAW